MRIHTRIAGLCLSSLWLGVAAAGCPGPSLPPCGLDGGGPPVATALFEAFLADSGLACKVDSDCALIGTPCDQSFESCAFTKVSVPRKTQASAEELASSLTAEQCPVSCQSSRFDAPLGPVGINCPVFGTPAAICSDAGQCDVGDLVQQDAGRGAFELDCQFSCDMQQFCDIESLEAPCPHSPGVFAVSSGQGICASATPANFDNSCASDQDCGFDSACINPATGGACQASLCSTCCVCQNACPTAAPTACPPGCTGLVDDGRHCSICACPMCPS